MPQKRANGEGSIRKRSDGRWEARYVSPKDGKQRSVYGKTQKDVRQKLTQIMGDIDGGSYVDPVGMTVEQWLEEWLRVHCKHVKATTLSSYRRHVQSYILPYIGDVRMCKLTKLHIVRMINSLLEAEISPGSINTVTSDLSSAMEVAVEHGIIRINPCIGVKKPKVKRGEMAIVEASMLPEFLAAANKTKHGDIITFALQTGLRAGELRGLRWQDVDLNTGMLTVSRQIAYIPGQYIEQSAKNGEARSFRMSSAAVELLKRHRKEQQIMRMAKGSEWIEDDITRDLVFRMPNGSHYKMRTLHQAVKKAGAAVGLDMSPHDLRHSFAVSALSAGADVKSIQHILGHATADFTLNVYVHYTEELGNATADRIDAYWEKALF